MKRSIHFLPVLCAVLALCVVFLSCVCLYYVKVNGALAQENINLSRALYETTQEPSGGTTASGGTSFSEWTDDNYTNGYLRERERLGLPFFIASENSDKYHLPSCEYAKNILPENRIEINSKLDLAIVENKGYSPCSVCKPDKNGG